MQADPRVITDRRLGISGHDQVSYAPIPQNDSITSKIEKMAAEDVYSATNDAPAYSPEKKNSN